MIFMMIKYRSQRRFTQQGMKVFPLKCKELVFLTLRFAMIFMMINIVHKGILFSK